MCSGYLARHPWRALRLVVAIPATLRFCVARDRGTLKGAFIHAALGGARRDSLQHWTQRFVTQLLAQGLYPQGLQAVAQHRAQGDRLLLMSASPDLYVPEIATRLGFDAVECSTVRWRGEQLDGRLQGENCRGEEKRRRLAALIARDSPARLSAYGNSDSDFSHMQLADEAWLVNMRGSERLKLPVHMHAVRWGTAATSKS